MDDRPPLPADSPWTELGQEQYDEHWTRFGERFGFRAGVDPQSWPAIREPTPSVTFDLSGIPAGPARAAAYDAVNAEALRAFVWHLSDHPELLVLDWQHPAHRVRPAALATATDVEWRVPVYPDGDYHAFLTDDFTEGTFGHPWEQTICVLGDRLTRTLARTWATWLPVKRENGQPV